MEQTPPRALCWLDANSNPTPNPNRMSFSRAIDIRRPSLDLGPPSRVSEAGTTNSQHERLRTNATALDRSMAPRLRRQRAQLFPKGPKRRHSGRSGTSLRAATEDKELVALFHHRRRSMEGQHVTCSICLENMQKHYRCCALCKCTFCDDCFSQHVKHKITDGQVTPYLMTCPGLLCKRPLTSAEVEAAVDARTFAKFNEFLSLRTAGVRYCPRLNCGERIEEARFTTTRRVYCSLCKKISCMRCEKDYHKVALCRRADSKYRKWKRSVNARHCPSCMWEIEKSGGCSHMSCSRCGCEFCWYCLQEWHDHDDLKCLPLSVYHSQNRLYGPTASIRALTKSATTSVVVGILVIGAGISLIAFPTYYLGRYIKYQIRDFSNNRKRRPDPAFDVSHLNEDNSFSDADSNGSYSSDGYYSPNPGLSVFV